MNILESSEARKFFERNLFYITISLDELAFMLKDLNELVSDKREFLENELINCSDDLKRDKIESTLYYYQNQPTFFLTEATFLSLIITLENEIDTYCKGLKKSKNLSVGYNDFKGDMLDKFKIFLSKILLSEFDFNSTLWQNIQGLYEVRNCFVHNRGSLIGFGKRKAIENFIKFNKSFAIGEMEDVIISQQACLDSIKIVETFFSEITGCALHVL